MRRSLATCLMAAVILGFGIGRASQPAPVTGWTTSATVVDVYDGDTLTVEVTRRMRVRLLDCWCSEVRTRDKAEKKKGIAAREHLKSILPVGSEVVLQIPNSTDLGKSFSFGRVLGQVWDSPDSVESVAEKMVAAGHATKSKPKR